MIARVNWGAIFAGVFIAMASMVFFSLFAIAAGIQGVNVVMPLPSTITLGAAIYAIITSMASFALAGFCTVRLAQLHNPGTACLHALATFGVTGALVPMLFTRAVFFGAPGFAVAPAPGMLISSGMAWTLFLSFGLASVACSAGAVQATFRPSRVGEIGADTFDEVSRTERDRRAA